jgi:porphobilinogen synthase
MRDLVSETHVVPRDLIWPLFVKEGLKEPKPIESMPGVSQHSPESLLTEIDAAVAAGLRAVMLFGVPKRRDELGSEACNPEGVLSKAVSAAKQRANDRLLVIADLCLDEFTSHGHCGVLDSAGSVDNDVTLRLYAQMAIVLANAGADVLGLSGMMDNQVAAVRDALDDAGHQKVAILAYSAKYASNFYGPFRDAVDSELKGDRKTYQQDWRNRKEATREALIDISQGADIVMVKPALAYLDIISDVAAISEVPVAGYIVSGEYAMVELAAQKGLVNREQTIAEVLHSVKRAGAQIICSYWAKEYAERYQSEDH